MHVEQRAEFILVGAIGEDVDLDAITGRLGIEPTNLQRSGALRPSDRRYDRSVWIWDTEDVTEWDGEVVLCQVLDRFDPVADAVRSACRDWNLTAQVGLIVSLYCDVETDNDGREEIEVPTPSLSFDPQTVARIARLGATLDIDQYVRAPDRA